MSIFVIIGATALVPIGLLWLFFYRTLSFRQGSDVSLGKYSEVSPSKYRPMERLLDEGDFRFLAGQPGFSPEIGRRFRAARRRIFRGYLRQLKKDFGRISMAVHALIIHAAEDRPDLAAAIIRLRLLFAVKMLAVEASLLLHAVGVGTVDASGMVEYLENMQGEMRLLLAPPLVAAAEI